MNKIMNKTLFAHPERPGAVFFHRVWYNPKKLYICAVF